MEVRATTKAWCLSQSRLSPLKIWGYIGADEAGVGEHHFCREMEGTRIVL